MAEESFEERTERATPRRREEAKRKGQVPRSREIPSVMVLLGGVSIITLFGSIVFLQLSHFMVEWFKRMANLSLTTDLFKGLTYELVLSFLIMVGPILAILFLIAIGSYLIQGNTVLATELLKPSMDRLSLVNGIKRMFSIISVTEFAKSLLKLLIVGWVAYSTIDKEWENILLLFGQGVQNLGDFVTRLSIRLLLRTIVVMMVLAILDYIFQRYTYEKKLRMSKLEVKEEFKQTEGDPLVKARIRSVQRRLARQRMMAQVPKADVIITNPTHIAVALLYESKTMDAPQVVAKGAGWIAEKIVEIGRNHGVPVIENKPLAQAIYKTVEIGKSIPSQFYHAVAEILAYVYRLKNRKP